MEVVAGHVTIEDVGDFLERLQRIGHEHDCLVQAVDARYVAGREHLERAVTLARRAHDRGESIADELAVEVLLYIAGTRQIDRAFELGVAAGEQPIAVLVDGGAEAEAVEAIREVLDAVGELAPPDEERISSWFEIDDRERAATAATLSELVLERVALLEVEK